MTHRKKNSKKKPKAKEKGIRDWGAKRAFLRAFFDVRNDTALVDQIVEGLDAHNPKFSLDVRTVYNTFRKWDGSTPSGKQYQAFWDLIIREGKLKVGMLRLWTSTIIEFVDFFQNEDFLEVYVGELLADQGDALDENTRRELSARLDHAVESTSCTTGLSRGEYYLRCYSQTTYEGPLTAVKTGNFRSSHIYTVPEAAKAWANMVDSEKYVMYLDCLHSLKQLVESNVWTSTLNERDYDAAVTLGGGGSPDKDWILATSLLAGLKPGLRLDYVVNDISFYMINDSVKVIQRRLEKQAPAQPIDFGYTLCDFLELDATFRRPDCQHLVWAIFGGTLGNVSERDFFRSLRVPSKVDDLLVIGVDTHDGGALVEFQNRMATQYHSEVLDTLLAPITVRVPGERTPRVTIEVETHREDERDNLSSVPNSRTATFNAALAGNEHATTVMFSTRYVLDDLLDYARQFGGWEHLHTEQASPGSTFRELLFRRIE